jgi:hypothetical protein
MKNVETFFIWIPDRRNKIITINSNNTNTNSNNNNKLETTTTTKN